jgi:hypothetical protein
VQLEPMQARSEGERVARARSTRKTVGSHRRIADPKQLFHWIERHCGNTCSQRPKQTPPPEDILSGTWIGAVVPMITLFRLWSNCCLKTAKLWAGPTWPFAGRLLFSLNQVTPALSSRTSCLPWEFATSRQRLQNVTTTTHHSRHNRWK